MEARKKCAVESDYVYFIPGRNPLIEPNNVGVLADVENESTGTRSKPVGINHGPQPLLGSNQPLASLALSFHRFSFHLALFSLRSFFSFFFLAWYPLSLSLAFYSDTREHVCVDVSSFTPARGGNAPFVVIFQTREAYGVPKWPHLAVS